MEVNKFLSTCSILAVVSGFSIHANNCSAAFGSGFYVGVNSGINHGVYSTKEDSDSIKMKKTRYLLEAVLGYEHKFSSIIAGVDLEFGTSFGTMKKEFEYGTETGEKAKDKSNIKSKYHIGLMPKIGYRCTPNLNIYLTGGIQYVRHESWNTEEKIGKYRKGRIHPVAGVGARYDFSSKIFIKLEYDHIFKTKVAETTKYRAHVLKMGLGYVF